MKTFGVIGLGYIFGKHKEAIEKNGASLALACDKEEGKKSKLPAYTDFTQNWEDVMNSEVDYVSILSPNFWHYRMAVLGLLRDKKIILEKPPVIKKTDLLALIEHDIHDDISVVLQLRYHPEVLKLKEKLPDAKQVFLRVVVKRDAEYWKTWKGEEKKSGGILFNIGVHYLDLLVFLYGNNYKILKSVLHDKTAHGIIDFNGVVCNYYFEIQDQDEPIDRSLTIGEQKIQLSDKENLSQENLHTKVYEEVLAGRGISLMQCKDSILLIHELKNAARIL